MTLTLWTPRVLCFAAVLVSGSVLLGALAFQYWGGLAPCPLCIWQRWPHVFVVAAGFIGVHLDDRKALICLGLTALGFLVAGGFGVFHSGVEMGWWEGLAACSGVEASGSADALKAQLLGQPIIRCDEVPWSLLSLSLADYNWLISFSAAGVLAAGLMKKWKDLS